MALIRAGLLLAVVGAALWCAGGCAGTADGVVDVADFEQPVTDETGYRLRLGDEVRVMFPAERSLDYTAPVSPAGTISVPSGGEVVAAGKTVAELRVDVEAAMSSMLLDPQSAIVLERIAEHPVYVLGEVSNPGAVTSPAGIRLSMALAGAGGLLSTGKPSSVMIVRTTGVPEAVAIKADVSKVLSGSDLAQDLELEPYDVVFVPKSVIGKVDEFVELFFTRIAPAQLFYLRGYDIVERGGFRFYQ
jgi:protein involved in polysaccharide export with SLBB domain